MYIEPHPELPDGPPPRLIAPALESLLNQSMLRVDVVAELHRCGSWFLSQPRYSCGLFHLVGAGRCTFECPALGGPVQLEAGDLVVLPQGDAHRLSVDAQDSAHPDRTSFICGELKFLGNAHHPLSHALPACFVTRSQQAGATFRQLSAMMVEMVDAGLVGRQVLLNKLADALFTLAVCDYASRAGTAGCSPRWPTRGSARCCTQCTIRRASAGPCSRWPRSRACRARRSPNASPT